LLLSFRFQFLCDLAGASDLLRLFHIVRGGHAGIRMAQQLAGGLDALSAVEVRCDMGCVATASSACRWMKFW
jgi:hypothetical protein